MSTNRKRLQFINKKQNGEIPIGTILVIALIVIPLVFLLIAFRNELSPKFDQKKDDIIKEF